MDSFVKHSDHFCIACHRTFVYNDRVPEASSHCRFHRGDMKVNYIEYDTACGRIRGIEAENWVEFRGIRYASAGRFEYPEPITGWNGIYDATGFGDCAYQHRAFDDDAKVNPFYHREFRAGLSFTYSEDCLCLNIWVPKCAKDCPVLIYIHGGSFTGGSSNEGHISGAGFAEKGIILVAINYRLGPFGFCSHPDVRAKNGACGNQGLFDQAAAIQWIRDNIASFGGNPHKITLMGQSAGAMSVDILLSSPLCKDRIGGAILMSGAGLQRLLARPVSPEKTTAFWNEIMKNTGASSMEELKKTEPRTLYYAWLNACKTVKHSMRCTFPVYDGVLLREGEFSLNTIADVPTVLGVTSADIYLSALQYLVQKWAKYAGKKNRQKCYVYNFTRNLPGDQKGAWHSCDLLYAFSTLAFNWRPFEEIDYEISKQLSESIGAFVRTGDPNCDAIPEWDADYKRPMRFCENTRSAHWDTFRNLRHTFSGGGE